MYERLTDEVCYPFGFGLSYTSFEYKKASLKEEGENLNIAFTLENTGELDGAEVVQIYAAKPLSCVTRVPKELKAFKKVFLKAGEEKEITISLPISDLAYYNPALKGWVVEPGDYKLYIAAASNDIRLTLGYTAVDTAPYTIKQISEGMIG